MTSIGVTIRWSRSLGKWRHLRNDSHLTQWLSFLRSDDQKVEAIFKRKRWSIKNELSHEFKTCSIFMVWISRHICLNELRSSHLPLVMMISRTLIQMPASSFIISWPLSDVRKSKSNPNQRKYNFCKVVSTQFSKN